MSKEADAFRTISEVADDLDIPKHVLRFWEAKFTQIRPMKRGGGRRYYRPEDLELLKGIRQLLHRDGYTIKGVQKILREQGVDAVKARAAALAASSGRSEKSIAAGAAVPSDASAPRLPVPPARRRRAPPGSETAAPPAGAEPGRSQTIAAIIAELEACRDLLRGATGEAPAARSPRTPASSTG